MPGRRGALTALLAVLALPLLAGCDLDPDRAQTLRSGPTSGVPTTDASDPADEGLYDPTEEDEAAFDTMLNERAAAVLAGDEAAFLATVDPDRPELRRQQAVLFRNLVTLGPQAVRYERDPATYLLPAPVPGDDPVVHPVVVEQVLLAGTMRSEISNTLDLTLVQRDGTWLVGAELAPGEEGAFGDQQERPWWGRPIAARRDGDLLVLTDADDAGRLPGLVDAVRAGIARDAELLDLEVDEAVLVDATSNGVAVGFSQLVDIEAAATTFSVPTYGPDEEPTRIAGTAIKVNPDMVDRVLSDDQTMWHELAHYLLQDRNPYAPVWLVEGIASWVEWQPAEMAQLVVPDKLHRQLLAADRKLPSVGLFRTDPAVNYPLSQAAVEWLVDRGGVDQVLELMAAYEPAYDGPNTDRHTARLLREIYGIRERELVAGAFERLGQLQH